MKRMLIVLTSLFIFCSFANSQNIFMTVDATMQGRFKGESLRQKGDKMDVTGATLEVATTTDAATGLARGRRVHQPFIVRKPAGAASPQFFQALVSNEILKKVLIEFYGVNPNGEMEVIYTITLENARVSGFKQSASPPENTAGVRIASGNSNLLYDEIKITYQKITVESNTGKTMSVDDASRL